MASPQSACSLEISSAALRGKALRTARLMIRLGPDDKLLLRERAAARGMAPATYVSVLTRAHLRSLAPLPKDELLALKPTVAELGSIGRNWNQIARAANLRPACEQSRARRIQGNAARLSGAWRSRQGAADQEPQVLGAGL